MIHASLFSGIGGFDLASEWMGWENLFHCEWNPFGQQVLKHHFPNSQIKIIQNAGHWLHAENPVDFYNFVIDFTN